MDSFNGTWVYLNSTTSTITENNNLITVTGNGQGPFYGFEVDVVNPVITVNFTNNTVVTGVLSQDGTTIYWNNGTTWVKD